MRVLFLACMIGAAASPALAGDWRSPDSVWAQRDVPGDYRCDAFWDRGRTDCHEPWRDQRRYARGHHDRHHHHGWRGHDRRYDHGYARGYGRRYGSGYDRHVPAPYGQPRAQAFHGAYGRPDLVYGGGGYAPAPAPGVGRDPARIDWCLRTYRSYDPHTGYYLAYSGRRVWCG